VFRLFFDTLQSVFGERLASGASLLHVAAVLLLVGVWLLPPVTWGVRRWRSAHGVNEGTVVRCAHCGFTGSPFGLACRHCGRELELPSLLRLSLRLREWRTGRFASRLAAFYHGLGLVCLYVLTGSFAVQLDLFRPGPDLRKLFIAIGTIALVGSCILFRRAFSLHSAGGLSRFTNFFFGLSGLGFVLLFLFVASATAPVEGRYLGTVRYDGSEVAFDGLRVPTREGNVGIEYLQIDQAELWYHRIFLMALEGSDRAALNRDPISQALLAHLARSADRYEQLGFTVRVRVERRVLTVGVPYVVYSFGREISFERVQ
jgi:hypothetical protein